ncbi:MAG: exo-alpha-sialidase [Planctomycetota bacterium]|nr:exo-alpha-sialidase [Planctomycetota bacterium]
MNAFWMAHGWRVTGWFFFVIGGAVSAMADLPESNRAFRTIFNNDTDNVLYAVDSGQSPQNIVADYRRAIAQIAESRPGIMAQNVGNPDPVIYRSREATAWSKYIDGPVSISMNKMIEAGTDPLQVTIEVCREHGVPVVASYRMNAEDFYEEGLEIQDFGRKHKHLAIPDPAHPVVYQHRMAIFREVAENYDIDGIEFDFRRWTHMISDPLQNHPILTRMVRETRQMLDEVAKRKGKKRLILGVRVGPSLDTPQEVAKYAGLKPGNRKVDPSCRELGLDVKTWVQEGLVSYICPSLFWPSWPGLPRTREFSELAKGHDIGIYPTIFPRPAWLDDSGDVVNRGPIEPSDRDTLQEYKDGFCNLTLRCYDEGADGVSMFNWYYHLHLSRMPRQWQSYYGYGMGGSAIQKYLLSIMGDRQAVGNYQRQSWYWPPEYESLLTDVVKVTPSITVHHPRQIPPQLAAQRNLVGIANDAQPTLGMLPSGDAILVLSHSYDDVAPGKVQDEQFLSRSADGGRKWSRPVGIPLIGRHPHMTTLPDGTILVTSFLMANDTANVPGYASTFLHRSIDGGKRWTSVRLSATERVSRDTLRTSHNVVLLPNGELLLGVSSDQEGNFLWRSEDKGITWDKSLTSVFSDPSVSFAGAQIWSGANGELWCVASSGDPQNPAAMESEALQRQWKIYQSKDNGRSWQPSDLILNSDGRYASRNELHDLRVLWTLTDFAEPSAGSAAARGVQGILGPSATVGPAFEVAQDILQLADAKSSRLNAPSSTIETKDGQLLTAYSYRDSRDVSHVMVVRWQLPKQ